MKYVLLVFILYQFAKAFIRFLASGAGAFDSFEAIEAVLDAEAVETVDSEVSPVSIEEISPSIENTWNIRDMARKILSYSDLKDLRATADVSVELRAASEEAKRDMPIISLTEMASQEYLENPEYRDSFRNMKPVQLNLDSYGTRKYKDVLISLNAFERTAITINHRELDEYKDLPFRQVNVELSLPYSPTLYESLREFTNLGKITINYYGRNPEDQEEIDLRDRVLELLDDDVSRLRGIVANCNPFQPLVRPVPEFLQLVQRISSHFGSLTMYIDSINWTLDSSLLTSTNLVSLVLRFYDGVFDGPNLFNVKNLLLSEPNIASLPFISNLQNLERLLLDYPSGNIILPRLDLPHLQYLRIIDAHILSLDFILSMPKLEILKISLPPQPLQIFPQVAARLARIQVLELRRDGEFLSKATIVQSLLDLVI